MSSGLNACSVLSVEIDTVITGNITTAGNITAGGISGNTISVADGANLGTITQVSTELTLSSSGNRVAIPSGSSLIFKNDSTTQWSAYTARELIDDCEIFTSVYNAANPSNLIYALSSTFAINQAIPTTITISANTIYAYPIRLVKGQVVNGAGFFLAVSGTPSITYGLYSTANPAVRLAVTAATNPTSGLINFLSAYTVPTSGIYYVCLFASSVGSGVSVVGMAANTYMNYNQSTMTTGVLNKAAQTSSTAGGLAATLSGLTMTLSTQVAYALVYTGTPGTAALFNISITPSLIPLSNIDTLATYLRNYMSEYRNSDFYFYNLDGDATYISDGGSDMYDNGNFTTPWLLSGVSYDLGTGSSVSSYPFRISYATTTATTVDTTFRYVSLGYDSAGTSRHPLFVMGYRTSSAAVGWQIGGNAGADGGGSTTTNYVYNNSTVNGFTVYAGYRHIYGTSDPNITNLIILLGHSSWNSVFGTVTLSGSTNTDSCGMVMYAGAGSANILAISVLLSKPNTGTPITNTQLQTVVQNITNRINLAPTT